jgi:hypothetical protein
LYIKELKTVHTLLLLETTSSSSSSIIMNWAAACCDKLTNAAALASRIATVRESMPEVYFLVKLYVTHKN